MPEARLARTRRSLPDDYQFPSASLAVDREAFIVRARRQFQRTVAASLHKELDKREEAVED